VQYKGVKFLVDMGNGTISNLQKLGLTGPNAPHALFITHHHIDHNAEFIDMVHAELLLDKDFLIAGPSPIDEMTSYTKKFYKEDLNYRMQSRGKTFDENKTKETIMVLKGGESFDYKGIKITTLEVPHTIKAIAYRFEAGGKSIVVTGDLSYTNELAILAKNADILVIDGKTTSNANGPGNTNQQRNQQNPSTQSIKAHASLNEIAKMAAECNPKNLVLTHLGNQPANEEATLNFYADQGFKGKLIIASDLLTITPDGNKFITEPKTTVNANSQNLPSPIVPSTNNTKPNNIPAGGQPGDPMARLDTNGDNKISESEAKGPLKENFATLDTNKDGFISADELKNRRKQR
jgi:ribonuclease BN (tRNA processing enzyme)